MILKEKLLTPFILAIVLFWHFMSITTYPTYFPDDAMSANRIQTTLELNNSVGSIESYAFNFIPGIEKTYPKYPYYIASVPSLLFGKISLLSVRSINLICILLILVLTYLVAKELKDWKLGLVALILLGVSKNFTYSSHIARLDIFSSIAGLCCVYIFLINKNKNIILDFLIACILVSAVDFHPRVIIYIPILICLYLQRYKLKAFSSLNCWSFALGGLFMAGIYYIFYFSPNSNILAQVAKMTIGSSRDMPILSLDYVQFYKCLNEIILLLRKEHLVYLAFVAEIFLLSFVSKDFRFSVLLSAALFFTSGVMRNFYEFNSIIILPVFVIGSASFIRRLLDYRLSSFLAFYLLLTVSYNSISIMNRARNSSCNEEFEQNAIKISKMIKPEEKTLSVDSYWFFMQKHNFNSWVVLKYIMHFKEWSLQQVFNYLQPKYLIADGRFFYFVKKNKKDSDWYNSFRIDHEEFNQVIKNHAKVIYQDDQTCNGALVVYEFSNWQ